MTSPAVSQDQRTGDELFELRLAHLVKVTEDVLITYGGVESSTGIDTYRFKLNVHHASWSDVVTVCVARNMLSQPACAYLVTDSNDGLLHIPGVSGAVHSFTVDHVDHYRLVLSKVVSKSA